MGSTFAQDILAPPPSEFMPQPTPFYPRGTNQIVAPPEMVPPAETVPDWLEWGPVKTRPHFLYRFLYGDGIPARPGEQFKTAINEIYPGVLFDLGDHWHLDYTPSLSLYSSSQFRNTFNNSVLFHGATAYQDWTFSLSQTYATSSQPLAETASQTDQTIYTTAINAAWHMSSKMSLELGLNQHFRFVGQSGSTNQLTDSMDWSTQDWLNYQFWQKFGAALGVGGGYNNVNVGSDVTYEQVQGRITWLAGTKLSLSLSGGFEDRQFLNSKAPDLISPLSNVALTYRIFEPTTLSLTGSRTVIAAFYQDQVTQIWSINASLRQRLLGKLYLDLGGGYTKTEYKATVLNTASIANIDRQDNYTFFNVRLTAQIRKRGTASIIYQASDNGSNASGYQYSSRQVGFELGYRL